MIAVSLDPWIVIAQIVNFLLLVWLLKRFLYEPVRKVIAERDARLQNLRRNAEEREAAAQAEEQRYKGLAAGLEAEQRRLLAAAAARAQEERERLLAEATKSVAAARDEMYEQLRIERADVAAEIRQGIVREACASAGKIMTELSGVSIVDAVIDAWGRRLAELQPPELGDAEDLPIEVRTSFELPPDRHDRLRSMVDAWIGDGATRPISFVHDPTLILGIEITVTGERIGWSARDLLESVEERALARIGRGPGKDVAYDGETAGSTGHA